MARRTIRARRSSPYLIALVVIFAVLFVAAAVGFGWLWSLRSDDLLKTFGQERLQQASKSDQDPFKPWFDKYGGKGALVDMIEGQEDLANQYKALVPPLTKQIDGDVPANLDVSQLKQSVSNDINTAILGVKDAITTLQRSYEGAPGAGGQPEIRATDMVGALKDLSIRVDGLVQQMKGAAATQAELIARNTGLQEEMKVAKEGLERMNAQLQVDMAAERNRLTVARDNALLLVKQVEQKLTEATDRHMA